MKRGFSIFIIVYLLACWVQQPFVPTHSFSFLFPLRRCRETRTCQPHDRHHALASTLTPTRIPTEEAPSSIEDFPQYQTSVLRGTTAQHSAAWQALLLPPPPSPPPLLILFLQPNWHRSADVLVDASVQWNPFHQPPDSQSRHVAEQLLQNAGIFGNCTTTATSSTSRRRQLQLQQQQVLDDLETSLQRFVDFCQQYYWPAAAAPSLSFLLKARIVATRGPAGTKCPQWHVDHVPVRWIQALVGPGCEWIVDHTDVNHSDENSAIHWDRINALNNDDNDDDDTMLTIHDTPEARNRLLMDAKRAQIQQAAPGEAVLLLGKTWTNAGMVGRVQQQQQRPAVHKSPTLQVWQGRVLLTMDVVEVEKENM